MTLEKVRIHTRIIYVLAELSDLLAGDRLIKCAMFSTAPFGMNLLGRVSVTLSA
ncbi:MAG: hypothetical protein P1U34_12660 [Coxiellaceae bacterium]|nr:hypothetical protein [Coxiellaceae bacterium]